MERKPIYMRKGSDEKEPKGMMEESDAPKPPSKRDFIKRAIKRPGQLHKDLGVPQGQKIPPERIQAASHAPGKLGQRARFALVLNRIRKGK